MIKLDFTRRFCALAIGIWLLPATGQAAGFLSAAPDIPLAAGLSELQDGRLVFDKPQGRIVQMTALLQDTTGSTKIADFYRASLPNLGWQLTGDGESILTFTRQGEILRLTFTADLVIFDVTPLAE